MIWGFPKRSCCTRMVEAAMIVSCFVATSNSAEIAEQDPLIGKPVVGRNADGHLEIFKIDSDGELRHSWQKVSNGDWSAWSSLGGPFFPGVAVANDTDGRMLVFAVDRVTQGLSFIAQKGTNSLEWSNWGRLGGAIRAPVCIGQLADGSLEVFAVGAVSGAVKHLRETNGHSGWTPWEDLGGTVGAEIKVARNRDGRLELFGLNPNNKQLLHRWQNDTNAPRDWTAWTSLGGSCSPGFAVGQNVLGRVEVFVVNSSNGAVERICQVEPGNSREWTAWQDFGGNMKPGISLGQSADGRLEILAVDAREGTLMHRWENLVDGSDQWSVWKTMGATAQPYPAVGQNEDGNLEVFAVDATNGAAINHKRQISRASDWLDWSTVGHATFPYSCRTWQTDEGLPHNMVQAIAQTRDGFLWVGTHEGLARFDGVLFTPFRLDNGERGRDTSITTLCADQQGALWIGTDGEGLFRLSAGELSHFGKTNGLAGDTLKAIYESRDGSLWIGTATGMSRYQDGKFSNFTKKDGLLSDVVISIYEDRDSDLWIATGGGLNRLKGKSMESFAMPNGLPNDSVRGICQDRGGRIWIGSNNGMLWYNWYWGKSFYAYNTRYGLSDSFVSAICEDHEGNLWVGTYSGLNRFREGKFFAELNNEGMPFDRVNSLFEDREGNLWVGSREGLSRLTPKRFFSYGPRQGLTHNNVMSVLEDRTGSLWVGTWGGGLNQIKDDRVTSRVDTNGFYYSLVLGISEGHDGSLWVGADFDGGLTRFKDNKFTYYTWKNKLIKAAIKVIHEDRNGNLWIGTSGGLSCLKAGQFTNYTNQSKLAGNDVRAIFEDHEGSLWFGTDGGLSCLKEIKGPNSEVRFRNFTVKDGLSDNRVTALYEDREQNLWIGTAAGGLNRFRQGRFSACTTRQGLFSDEIFEILEDDAGWLWMSCSKGVFRVRKQDLDALDQGKIKVIVSHAYGKTDGMESPQCNGAAKPAGWKTRDGRLWFPTSKGVVVVDPLTTKINEVPPPVYVESLLADKKEIAGTAEAGFPPLAQSAGEPLEIGPGRGELEVRYTALNLQAPENTRFKYKLDGVDSDWIDAGSRRTANYNKVPPGHYIFRVIACNKDGIWNESGASLTFTLLPHFWETWWWQATVALVVIGVASGTARYLTKKKMQRDLEILEQRHAIERERGRIAKDIHDDLGSSLTRIMMLGERAEEGLDNGEQVESHVRKIVTSARQTVQSLDEIVWAVNPENDTLEGLVEYISHYADEFFEDTAVSCRLEIPMQLPSIALPAEVRHDLFLVVKEAFNNVLKHSRAGEIRVQVSATAASLEILIEDNGGGFDTKQMGNGRKGNGLRNMRKRIEGLGGQLGIESALHKGTRIKISVKLEKADIETSGNH